MRARSLQPGKHPRPLTHKEVPAIPPSPGACFHAGSLQPGKHPRPLTHKEVPAIPPSPGACFHAGSLQPGKHPRPLTHKEVPAIPPSPGACFHAGSLQPGKHPRPLTHKEVPAIPLSLGAYSHARHAPSRDGRRQGTRQARVEGFPEGGHPALRRAARRALVWEHASRCGGWARLGACAVEKLSSWRTVAYFPSQFSRQRKLPERREAALARPNGRVGSSLRELLGLRTRIRSRLRPGACRTSDVASVIVMLTEGIAPRQICAPLRAGAERKMPSRQNGEGTW